MTLALPADIAVTVWFDLVGSSDDFFTLDDDVRGELDNTTYLLAGAVATDISADVIAVSISRGKSSMRDKNINAGTCTITLDNSDRQYDPLFATSPYVGNITPGKRVRVTAAGVPIFDGLIDDWDYRYTQGRTSEAIIIAADALASLGRMTFLQWTTTDGQVASERIGDVLNRVEVGYPANRDIVGGRSVLQSDLVTWGSNVLNYLQLVAESDLGLLFASRDGVLTYRDRHSVLSTNPTIVFDDGDPDALTFDSIESTYGSEMLYNRVGVDRENGILQTVSDATSRAAYGNRSIAIRGLLLNSDAQSLDMANYLLGRYKSPELRFSRLEVDSHLLGPEDRTQVVALDMGDVVRVKWTPSGITPQVNRRAVVLGVRHRIDASSHVVTVNLGDLDQRSFLVLDSADAGVLDSNLLAF